MFRRVAVALALLALPGGRAIAAEWNDVEGRIEFAWYTEDLRALRTVIATLPQFVAKSNRVQMQGITYIGDLGNKKIFSDPHYPTNEFLE